MPFTLQRVLSQGLVRGILAFNNAGELTAKAIERIQFDNTSVWDIAHIQSELEKNQSKEVTTLKEIGYDYYVSGRAKKSLSNSMGDNLYLFQCAA